MNKYFLKFGLIDAGIKLIMLLNDVYWAQSWVILKYINGIYLPLEFKESHQFELNVAWKTRNALNNCVFDSVDFKLISAFPKLIRKLHFEQLKEKWDSVNSTINLNFLKSLTISLIWNIAWNSISTWNVNTLELFIKT